MKLGKYEHFKGGQCEVLGIAKHSESLEEFVVYRELSDGGLWIRPVRMFLEEVDFGGKKVQRFKYVGL